MRKAVDEVLSEGELFTVGVTISPQNEIEVIVDSDHSVDLDSCVALNRALTDRFGDELDDYSLSVVSAGIGQPLRLLRQYRKLIGGKVEVLLLNGTKILAELRAADPESITLAYTEMRTVEGRKRKEPVEMVVTYPLSEVKTTREYLDFK